MGLDPDELEVTIGDSITEGKPITPYPQNFEWNDTCSSGY